jgi:hypothetical protein
VRQTDFARADEIASQLDREMEEASQTEDCEREPDAEAAPESEE